MKILFFILALWLVIAENKAQYYASDANNTPDTFYYPYQNGIQMIEIAQSIMKSPDARHESKYLSAYNIYIFRNESGEIINIYNQRDYTIDIKKLRPSKEKVYTEDFLLYQYTVQNYIDPNTKKSTPFFIYQDKDGKYGFINQAGDIILKAQYDYFDFNHKNIIIGAISGYYNLYGIIFLDNIDKSIDPIIKYINKGMSNGLYRAGLYRLGINKSRYIINTNSKKIIFSGLTEDYCDISHRGIIIYSLDSNGNESEFKFDHNKPNKPARPDLFNRQRYLKLNPPYNE